MLIINILIMVMFFMLYLISRKHFSKYKGVFGRMGKYVYLKIYHKLDRTRKKSDLRKVNVVSDADLEELVCDYYVRLISICMVIVFVTNLVCMISIGLSHVNSFLKFKNEKNGHKASNYIERGDYAEGVSTHEIYIGEKNDQTVIALEVLPRQYTEEEFYEKAEDVITGLYSGILGDNEDLQHVCMDLELPKTDETGVFEISWWNDYPEYISPSGIVKLDELEQETKVKLTANIAYLEYEVQHEFEIMLVPQEPTDDLIEKTGVVLKKLEEESRNQSRVELPSEILGQKVSLKAQKDVSYKSFLALAIVMCTITIIFSNNALKEKSRKRDNVLMVEYFTFVNKLWLLLGTGMTLRSCFINIVGEASQINKDDILIKELSFTLNQIASGYDEAGAYEELGERLGISNYRRLMSRVSQNLKLGTKDLRALMLDEVREAMESKKELAKKQGEEASTKLLFPMIMLMAVVIVVIMVPAFVGL